MRGWRAWARPHGRVAVRPCVGKEGNHEIHEIHERENNRTTNGHECLFSREEGEEGRGECVVGALGRARTAESPCVQ